MGLRTPWKWLKDEGIFGYNYWYVIRHFWIIPGEIGRRIKWFVQRGRRGYADCDAWDLHGYLLNWLPDAIAQLEKGKWGYPIGMTYKRWHKTLAEMEKGLRVGKKVVDMDYPREEWKVRQKEADKGLDLFRKHFWSLWD